MKNTFPQYYKKFVCIADKCSDTCCAGWEIVVDSESSCFYESLSDSYGKKIRSLMHTDSDGDRIFRNVNGRCPFLLENGLCEMYTKLGHSRLCRTCRSFPRFTNCFGSRTETGISLSCPEAARLIYESAEPVTFETEETDGAVIPSDFDAELYFTLLSARKSAILILQNRKFSIVQRICAFLEYSQTVQQLIKQWDSGALSSVDADGFLKEKREFSSSKAKRALNKIFSDFGSLEFIDCNFPQMLENAKNADMKGFQAPDTEYEHLAVYFVFRYFITAAYDGDLLTKAKLCAVFVLAIMRLHSALSAQKKEERIAISQKFSKETEHSAENMNYLLSATKKSRYYSVENIINILAEGEKI